MSSAAISYSSLRSASSEAKSVANKLTTYADHLNSSIYNKLNNYSGSHTENIISAKRYTNAKISGLRHKSSAYTKYATDLSDLKTRCDSVDKSVKRMVSNLTAEFKNANGIKNSKVVNAINYFLTSVTNSTTAGRWVSDQTSKMESVKEYIKQTLEDWWDYEGGEQLISGVAGAVLTLAGAILGVVFTILSGAAIPVIIAAIGACIIALLNFGVTIQFESEAYDATHNNSDPATGRRRSEIDSLADALREDTDSSFWHNVATALDFTKIVCDVVMLVNSAGKLIKNGYAWLKGLTSGSWTSFVGKIKEVTAAIKMGDIQFIKSGALNVVKDFGSNLKEEYLKFGSWKDTVSSMKNMVSMVNDFSKDGFNIKNIITDVVLPGVVLAENIPRIVEGEDGQMMIKLFDISADDIYSVFDKIKKIFDKTGKLFDESILPSDFSINTEMLDVLSEKCNINISVPEIYIPDIEMPVLRAA